MIHQSLFERGEAAGHESVGWRREIMRLNQLITGADIWARPSKVVHVEKRAVRINAPHPDGRPSMRQGDIARWPHSQPSIKLGRLGESNI
jgi:hypothetical protein